MIGARRASCSTTIERLAAATREAVGRGEPREPLDPGRDVTVTDARPGRALPRGGPIAAEIRDAVAADVAAFRRATADRRASRVVIVGQRRAVDRLPRADPARLRQGRHRGRLRRARGRGDRGRRRATRSASSNADPTVDGIIVQMPLPPTIRLRAVIDALDPAKDIDGIHPLNAGLLRLGYDGFLPATAHAAVEILAPVRHRDRGPATPSSSAARTVVGKPAAFLLVRRTRRSRSATRGPATSPAHVARRRHRRRRRRPTRASSPGDMLKPGRGRRRRRHQRRRRQARRRRRLRVGARRRLGDHAGPGRRRAAHQRAPADPPRPRRRAPGRRTPAAARRPSPSPSGGDR